MANNAISKKQSGNKNKSMTLEVPPEATEVIILNKPFLGGWLDAEGRIGHEIIDFIRADDGNLYVYNLPGGVCPDDIWVEGTSELSRRKEEKYTAKYMILTSATKVNEDGGCTFDIKHVIELSGKLHRFHTTKEDSSVPFMDKGNLAALMDKLDIRYGGRRIEEIFPDKQDLVVTFRAERMYEAKEPIHVSTKSYDFRRNKGYLYGEWEPEDYKKVLDIVKESIKTGRLADFEPNKVSAETTSPLSGMSFLELIGMEKTEQAYTNMLCRVLQVPGIMRRFCFAFVPHGHIEEGAFRVAREHTIVGGRMDICAESDSQRIVIENKVDSGLNGIDKADSSTQLSDYYNWACEKEMAPLCFITVPDYRMDEIRSEIRKYDPKMESEYMIVPYSQIAKFIRRELEEEFASVEDEEMHTAFEGTAVEPFVPIIVHSFEALSYASKRDLYAAKFMEAIRSE